MLWVMPPSLSGVFLEAGENTVQVTAHRLACHGPGLTNNKGVSQAYAAKISEALQP